MVFCTQVIKAMVKKDGNKMSAAIKMLKGNYSHVDSTTENMVGLRSAFMLHFLWKLPSVLLCLQSLPQRMTTGTLRGSWRFSASWANIPTSSIWSEPARTEVSGRPLVALLWYVLTFERCLFKYYYSSRGTAKIAEFQAMGYFTNVHLFGQAGRPRPSAMCSEKFCSVCI